MPPGRRLRVLPAAARYRPAVAAQGECHLRSAMILPGSWEVIGFRQGASALENAVVKPTPSPAEIGVKARGQVKPPRGLFTLAGNVNRWRKSPLSPALNLPRTETHCGPVVHRYGVPRYSVTDSARADSLHPAQQLIVSDTAPPIRSWPPVPCPPEWHVWRPVRPRPLPRR